MAKTITRTTTKKTFFHQPALWTLAGILIASVLVAGQPSADATVELRYVCTYGAKDGIHPPRLSNKKLAVAATGHGDHPYGLGFPAAVATDLEGRIWIADSGTASVHVFDRKSGAYREIRKAGAYTLEQPAGVACDREGRMYLVDTALSNVFVFENGEYARALMKPATRHLLTGPTVIAFSEDEHTIYVADPPKNAIVALNREGEVDATIRLTDATREPSAIAVVNNQIYVLGSREHRVEFFSPAGERRGELRWEGVQFPTTFAFDAANRRFLVANPSVSAVEIFDEEGRGLGAFGQLGDRADQHRRVDAVHVDARGLAYLVDSHHGKVLVFRGQ